MACGVGELVAGIAAQEFLEGCVGASLVVKVVLIDLANPKQGVEAELAAGLFATKEFVLLDGRTQDVWVIEASAHFLGHLRSGNHARVGAA
jgi:hypothetical protein